MPRTAMHLEIDRRDIRQFRLVETNPPQELPDGHVLLRLERAALTSNNISYAFSGEMLDYWGFFPTEANWGRLPVMGFGVVTASTCPDIEVGGRYFGFFPLGDHHVVQAQSSSSGFTDIAEWRAKHASTYKNFTRAEATMQHDRYAIFRGLFSTSFLLEDYLRENNFFGAQQIIVTSASSKTSIALANCLQRFSDVKVIGLTSARNLSFVKDVGEYDEIIDYQNLDALNAQVQSAVADMAGNPQIIADVHTRLKTKVVYSCSVGATHWSATRENISITEPRPEFFFAPSQLSKRSKEWGREELNRRIDESLALFIDSSQRWLTIQHAHGATEVAEVYSALVTGQIDPRLGNIVSFD